LTDCEKIHKVGYDLMSHTPPPEVYKLVGQRIRAAREKRGLSQEKLAERVDLTRTSITNIEKGRQKLLVHTLVLISDALAVPVVDLISDSMAADPMDAARKALPANMPKDARDWVISGLLSVVKGQT
jgi:transcriptional regulator with XRE-family HTH domain